MKQETIEKVVVAVIGAAAVVIAAILGIPGLQQRLFPPITPTVTLTSTSSITSDTATPTPFATIPATNTSSRLLALMDGCISPLTWEVAASQLNVLNASSGYEDDCYDLGALGISAIPYGPLYFLKAAGKVSMASGIYTPVRDNSVIEFKVHVNSLYIVYPGEPAYISFAIAPAPNALAEKETARFKLHVEKEDQKPIIFFMMADVGEPNGVKIEGQHYEYGKIYKVRFELADIAMRVFINDVRQIETLSIPEDAKVFYIGYTLPTLAGADVEITDITVDGVRK